MCHLYHREPHGARWQGGIGVSPELSDSLGLSSSDIPRNLRNGLRSILLRPRELLGTGRTPIPSCLQPSMKLRSKPLMLVTHRAKTVKA